MRFLVVTSVMVIAFGGSAYAQSAQSANEGEASGQALEPVGSQDPEIFDPWEGANRRFYAVHDVVDRWLLAPVARGYRAVAPPPVRDRVRNFLSNLNAPVVFANDVLQGEASRAGTTVARFGVNSTIGLLGLFDPAEGMGLEEHSEDFGQTLAVWGVDEGPYLFLPLFGPTNVRDGFGNVVDNLLDPLSSAEFEGDDEVALARGFGQALVVREELIEPIDAIRASSIDPYVAFRSIHQQMRDADIANRAESGEEPPRFDAPDEERAPAIAAVEALPSSDAASVTIEGAP